MTNIPLHFSQGTVRPNIGPNLSYLAAEQICSSTLWKKFPKAFRGEYVDDWDCKKETSYWYVIKDTPFDISELKAKRRYEITKAKRNFIVKKIKSDSETSIKSMFDVYNEAITDYLFAPPRYSLEEFHRSIKAWWHYDSKLGGGREMIVYGAYDTDNKLCGFAHVIKYRDHCSFSTLKTRPSAESKGINAAICYKIILDCNDDLLKGNFFISDGARNLSHVTHFQDYLQKYFGFRKAYCRLRVVYRPLFKPIIAILFLFKNFLKKFDSYSLFHKINAILLAEEVSRDCKLE